MAKYIANFALAVLTCCTLFVVAAENLPDPVQEPACSCAGKGEDCVNATFIVADNRKAYCSLWGRSSKSPPPTTGCCMIEPKR